MSNYTYDQIEIPPAVAARMTEEELTNLQNNVEAQQQQICDQLEELGPNVNLEHNFSGNFLIEAARMLKIRHV